MKKELHLQFLFVCKQVNAGNCLSGLVEGVYMNVLIFAALLFKRSSFQYKIHLINETIFLQ